MAQCGVIHVFFALGIFQKGLTAVIQTQQTVVAAVGEDARLSCQLMQHKEVLQVTWQKVLPEGEKNLATYSKHFGSRVIPDFREKVEIKDAGLKNCSIVIREVMEQDEGCYLCLFNTFPDGALAATTCLQLYELHEPILHVRESNSTQESLVSCSATGRPAPTLTLNVTQPHLHFSRYNTVSVHSSDGTVTVTTTAVLSGFRDNSAQVGCAVRVLSGHKEVFMMIPEVKQTSADGFQSGSNDRTFIRTWIVLVAFGCAAAALLITVLLKQKHHNRDHEMSEMPQTTDRDTDLTQKPLVTQENNQVRKETPTENNRESDNPSSSSSIERRLHLD
ncbi:OX-2 membrane glycoprotein-like isoform X2 [Seriola aureovittata]|uniref:OX-2 membrane glycoprotein-like isoform X2 n=1 Tax=Seriola aureovittata TaxID=2871759 RepID=UPI0024BE9C00|nr:OX-2 membrane glycoprotein-like isoform X2 [Seriola aureovittata]